MESGAIALMYNMLGRDPRRNPIFVAVLSLKRVTVTGSAGTGGAASGIIIRSASIVTGPVIRLINPDASSAVIPSSVVSNPLILKIRMPSSNSVSANNDVGDILRTTNDLDALSMFNRKPTLASTDVLTAETVMGEDDDDDMV